MSRVWTREDTVFPEDANRWEQGAEDGARALAGAEAACPVVIPYTQLPRPTATISAADCQSYFGHQRYAGLWVSSIAVTNTGDNGYLPDIWADGATANRAVYDKGDPRAAAYYNGRVYCLFGKQPTGAMYVLGRLQKPRGGV